MHGTDVKSQFIELRVKGWSLARIAAHLNVSARTLVDWNRQSRGEIGTLRALDLEALQEKILATHELELTRLNLQLQQIETELAKRNHEYTDTSDLFRLAALVRAEIRKVRLEPDLDAAYAPALTVPSAT